jgi:sugar phosphate isomerase/epimerase
MQGYLKTWGRQTEMQLGIFAFTFIRPAVEEVFDSIKACGLEHTEFNFTAIRMQEVPDQINEALTQRVRMAAAERGITIDSVGGYTNMVHPDPKQRQADMKRLLGLIRAARSLGTGVVALCTGSRDPENMWRRHPANDDPDAWEDLCESLSEAIRVAEDHDVTLTIEPEVNNIVHTAAKARRLLDEIKSPRLKVTFDGANIFHKGELPKMHELLTEAIDLLADDIILAHAKDLDHDGDAGLLAAGQGELDYNHYLGLLKKAGFAGSILLHGLEEDQVEDSISFVRSFLD